MNILKSCLNAAWESSTQYFLRQFNERIESGRLFSRLKNISQWKKIINADKDIEDDEQEDLGWPQNNKCLEDFLSSFTIKPSSNNVKGGLCEKNTL